MTSKTGGIDDNILRLHSQIDNLRLPMRVKQFISEGMENFTEDVALSMNNVAMSHW